MNKTLKYIKEDLRANPPTNSGYVMFSALILLFICLIIMLVSITLTEPIGMAIFAGCIVLGWISVSVLAKLLKRWVEK